MCKSYWGHEEVLQPTEDMHIHTQKKKKRGEGKKDKNVDV